jgi:ABC-2 type transport system permease protein
MRSLLAGFGLQLRRMVSERRYRVMLLLLVGLSCVGAQIYRSQVLRDLPIAVVDLDNSSLSRRLRFFLGSMRELRLTGEYVGSQEQARDALATGRIASIVVIPSSFSSDIKAGRKGEVLVAVDMSNILVGKNAHKAIARAVGTLGAGVQVTTLRKLGVRGDGALTATVPVVVDENFTFNPATNYSVYIVPGLVFFLLHVCVVVLGATIMLPGRAPQGFLGKLGAAAAVWLTGMLLGAGLLAVVLPWLQMTPASGATGPMALIGALVAADLVFVTAAFSIVPDALTAMELTVMVAMLSLMLSGITWPTDMFPDWLQQASRWLPFTPFARGLRAMLHHAAPGQDAWLWVGEMARQAAVFALLGAAAELTRTITRHVRARRVA